MAVKQSDDSLQSPAGQQLRDIIDVVVFWHLSVAEGQWYPGSNHSHLAKLQFREFHHFDFLPDLCKARNILNVLLISQAFGNKVVLL